MWYQAERLPEDYSLTVGNKRKPHHHVNLKAETKLDLEMWRKFLLSPMAYCTSFADFSEVTAEEILMYSDASKNFSKGFGAWCQKSWVYGVWNYKFMCDTDPSIEYLELFAVAVAVKLWIHRFKNKKVYLFCDNLSVVHMLNNSLSSCRNCMVLIRFITLEGLIQNVRILAKHVRTNLNGISDALSRLKFHKFGMLVKDMDFESEPTAIPEELWLMSKIWLK